MSDQKSYTIRPDEKTTSEIDLFRKQLMKQTGLKYISDNSTCLALIEQALALHRAELRAGRRLPKGKSK